MKTEHVKIIRITCKESERWDAVEYLYSNGYCHKSTKEQRVDGGVVYRN
jgi:hypothetical protein